MPRILVTTEPVGKPGPAVLLDERVVPDDVTSDHFAAQLVERIGWALVDADSVD